MEVGVQELRNNLSRYLDRVGCGEELVVTRRGRAVARVAPITKMSTLDRLVAAGLVSPARQPKRPAGRPMRAKGTVSDLLSEHRR